MVVCNRLHHTHKYQHAGALALSNAFYGPGTGDIYLSNLVCRGNESNLIECLGLGPGSFCSHREDAGVRCRAPGCMYLVFFLKVAPLELYCINRFTMILAAMLFSLAAFACIYLHLQYLSFSTIESLWTPQEESISPS